MHETLQANHIRARTNNRTTIKTEVEGKRVLSFLSYKMLSYKGTGKVGVISY